MKPELAEQLLYESEATLRLVDSLLDELQEMDHLQDGLGMRALQLAPGAESDRHEPAPDTPAAPTVEASTILASLARGRHVLERAGQEMEARWARSGRSVPSAAELRSGLESALALVDRLAAPAAPPSIPHQVREQLLALLEGAQAQEVTEQRLSYASGLLRDTELRVAALVQRLS